MPADISELIGDMAYRTYEKKLLNEIMSGKIPKHVAIIMDGNRRFAQELGWSSIEGHKKGREKLEEVVEWCRDLGIKVLTLFAFSTENLDRDENEVKILMGMFAENFMKIADDERVHKYKIRVKVIGQRELLPKEVQESIEYAESRTKDNDQYILNLAVAYGGRQEILRAIKDLVRDAKDGKIDVDSIDENMFSSKLYTADLPDPDLILRTSGEERISNFLLWQLAYSELYFADVYWPGLRRIDFLRAIRSYQLRQRRYGK
jgi:tritrans,polycis-undecaprenyl-diphosphate synthase [geranylgeranyl-diphosphate specific]